MNAQNKEVFITGKVTDAETNKPVFRMQIFNLRTGRTLLSDTAGLFAFHAFKNDSIYFSAYGYSIRMVSFRDSALHETYRLRLRLKKIEYQLPNTVITPKRDFETVQHEAQKLGYNKNDYMLNGIEALQSPVTALWQQFSRMEKDKREYAQIMDIYRKNQLLKEILHEYIDQGIVSIAYSEIDLFVDYCNVPEPMLQNATQYDIVMFMKTQLPSFRIWLTNQQHK
ncbi:MAG: hypothetical protein H0W62_06420 [Chitinophagales bacterium]|nr:hypothetical protein [Chitinophagales bacterium]